MVTERRAVDEVKQQLGEEHLAVVEIINQVSALCARCSVEFGAH